MRRLIGDSGSSGGVQLASGASVGGEIIFTFDGDAAGQKAALRAFGEDQSFSAQTFVAVEKSGMDPCELRQAKGPDAVRALVAGRTPLYEFVIRSTLASYDLRTAEGRIGALRAAAPIVAGIRDAALRPEYTRLLSGWLGIDDQDSVRRAVQGASTRPQTTGRRRPATSGPPQRPSRAPGARPAHARPRPPGPGRADRAHRPRGGAPAPGPGGRRLRRAPVRRVRRPRLPGRARGDPCGRRTHRRAAAGAVVRRLDRRGSAPSSRRPPSRSAPLVTELAVAPLPEDRPESLEGYVKGVVLRLVEIGFTRHIADLRGRLQRMDAEADPAAYQAAFAELVEVEGRRRNLRESA